MTTVSTSTSAFYDRSTLDMSTLRAQSEALQSSLSSGQRLSTSSDDPVAASRLRQLQRMDALTTVDTANTQIATTDLQLVDGALGSFADYVTRVQELATQAATGTLTPTQRAGIGSEIAAIRENIVQLANARDSSGNALFGGQTGGDAYTITAGVASYNGTATAGDLPLGDGQNVTRSLTGPEFLSFSVNGTSTDLMAVLKTLADGLQDVTGNQQQAARDGLAALDPGLDAITTAQTVVGTRLAWIDVTTTRRTDLSEMRSSEENDVGGTDIAATVAKLQETMTVLQASQASFTKLATLSLFDLIK